MIIYELDIWWQDLSAGFTLRDCLFGAVKLTKNTDQDKFSYSEYGTGLNSRSLFSIPNFDYGRNFVHPSILIIRKKIFKFLVKVQQKN